MLKGKNIILGVTGSVACYKAASLASLLVKQHCNLDVIMTRNAEQFINPLTFEALTKKRVCTDTFDERYQGEIEHITLSEKADAVIIAPASADIIAKLACGIADDMLTSTVIACNTVKIIAPAMNSRMYDNPVTQDNIEKLRHYGWLVIEPDCGHLACGTEGKGKLPSPEKLLEAVIHAASHEKDMRNLKVLVTAGPTIEAIDPVRYITNHSTGKMGVAIAKRAAARGANVTLVTGPTAISDPDFMKVVHIESAKDMFDAVTAEAYKQDIIIKAAAVADFTPVNTAEDKIKKTGNEVSSIELKKTADILKYLGDHKKEGQILCGFSMETKDLIENSRQKLIKKNLDMIAANNLKDKGAGFGTSTNLVTLITKDDIISLPLMKKEEVADEILSRLLKLR